MIPLDLTQKRLRNSLLSNSIEDKRSAAKDLKSSLRVIKEDWVDLIADADRFSEDYGDFDSFNLDREDGYLLEDTENLDHILEDIEKAMAILLNRKQDEVEPENMSVNIATLFGKDAKRHRSLYQDIDISDWRAPMSYGLDNSQKILDIDFYQANSGRNWGSHGSNGSGKKVTFVMQDVPSQDEQDEERDGKDNNEDDDEDDDEEDDEDEEDEYDSEQNIANTAMSPELMRLLGLEMKTVVTDWVPPSRPGLANSAPIIPSRIAANSESEEEEVDIEGEVFSKVMSPQLRKLLGLAPSEKIETDWVPPSRPGLDNSTPLIQFKNIGHIENAEDRIEEDEEDDDDDNGDDEEEDHEEDYDVDEGPDFESMPMSAALRKALGLPAVEIETDWRPPSTPGLDNSAPLVSFS